MDNNNDIPSKKQKIQTENKDLDSDDHPVVLPLKSEPPNETKDKNEDDHPVVLPLKVNNEVRYHLVSIIMKNSHESKYYYIPEEKMKQEWIDLLSMFVTKRHIGPQCYKAPILLTPEQEEEEEYKQEVAWNDFFDLVDKDLIFDKFKSHGVEEMFDFDLGEGKCMSIVQFWSVGGRS